MSQQSPISEKLWFNENRCLDFSEYEQCFNERQSGHNKGMLINYVVMILFFCAGLWALYENAIFMTVILLALSVQSLLISFFHSALSHSLNIQWLLAMLINKQSQKIDALRSEILAKENRNNAGEDERP